MNAKKLKSLRNKIDSLDNKIFNLIKKRTNVVKRMLITKRHKNQIVDHKRINQILKKIKKKSVKEKVDVRITNKIWKSMIWSYVDFQRRNFRKK